MGITFELVIIEMYIGIIVSTSASFCNYIYFIGIIFLSNDQGNRPSAKNKQLLSDES
jgi:hypothetical protein